jgi:hypothetical protein
VVKSIDIAVGLDTWVETCRDQWQENGKAKKKKKRKSKKKSEEPEDQLQQLQLWL